MILVEIAGFLGADPEERFTASGKRVVSLRVGVRVRQGGQDETVWWRVNIWGDRFDKMLTYLKKGSAVIVVGDMSKPETYTARDGSTQVSLTLSAEIIKFSPFGKTERTGQTSTRFTNDSPQQTDYAESTATPQYAEFGAASDGNAVSFSGDDLPF